MLIIVSCVEFIPLQLPTTVSFKCVLISINLVLGYFVAYMSEERNPPLVFVLSEKHCSMLLFPFINSEGDDLVECVVLPEIPIWVSKKAEEGALLNRQLLVVILLFCAGRDEGEKIYGL